MTQRRERYQSGTLWQEGGRWLLRYSEKHADGKTERPTVCVGTMEQYNTMKKARIAADAFMREVNDRVAVVKFEHLCDCYEREGLAHLRGYSRDRYVTRIRLLREVFKGERLDVLAGATGVLRMEAWLNALRTKQDAYASAAWRHDVRGTLGQLFKYAMKRGFLAIQRNPVDLVEVRNMPATTAPKRIKALPTLEQYRALLEDPYLPEICKVVVQVICCTGLRGCEAWALKAEDLDYRAGKIYVRRSAKGKYIDPPKSKESAATVCMEKPLATLLRRWMSTYPMIDGYLFASPKTGRPYSPNDMQQSHLSMAGRRTGIDNLGWHNFRHWHRALGRHVAATPEQQKMMMRHSTISMAMDVYGNQIDNADLVREPNRKIVSILMKTGTGE